MQAPSVVRTYTNFVPVRNLDNSPYGAGWTPRNIDLLAPDSRGAAFLEGAGNAWYFAQDGSGNYTTPETNSPFASLIHNTDGSYTVDFKDGGREDFAASGLPIAKSDKDGNSVAYAWNADGTLHTVANAQGTGTSTSYSAPSSQTLGGSSLVYAADVQGSTTDANGHASYYTTEPETGETLSATDATGANTTYQQYNDQGLVTQISQPPLIPGGSRLITAMDYDENGNMTERDFPDGTRETWTIDPTWNEPTVYVDPAGRETDYALDPANGDVLTVTQVGTGGDANLVTHNTYTPAPVNAGDPPGGLLATTIDPRGIETDLSYTSFGQISQIVYAVGTADQATVSMTYDSNQNPAGYTNELGQTTSFVFDNSDRKIGQQDPPPDPNQPGVRPTWAWVFDTRGNQVSQLDPMNRLTQRVYGPGSDGDEPDLDQIIQPDPAGGANYTVTTFGHDNAEHITSVTDPMQRLQSAGFDADNRQTSITMPNPVNGGSGGPTESVVYNALGFPVQQFDLMGGETDNTFNWRGQVLTTTGPAPTPGAPRPTETLTYNADGQTLTDQNPLLATVQDIYDSFGRLKEEILPDPDGSGPLPAPTLFWTHDGDGNVTSFKDANGNLYVFAYNDRNVMTEEDDPSPDGGTTPGPVWHWVYDSTGALTETIDPMNRVTQLVRDGDSNVIQTIAPNPTTGGPGDASTTTYDTFDLDNEKLSETTPNGATTSWQRDDLGRTTITTQPVPEPGEAAPVWQDSYNADSELTQEIDPLGRSRTTTLDGMGRPIGQTAFDGVETAWTYNNLSEILTTTLGTGALAQTTTNTWDALGRQTAVQDANGTTQMAFDLAGRMISLVDSDTNQTVWTRDNLGRVTAEQNASGTATFSYDTNSNLTKEVDRLGQERDFVFDDLNRETAEQWMNGSTVVNTISTAYNADGEVTSTGDNYSNYAFAYSGQGQVTSVDNAGTPGAPHVVLNSQYDTQGGRTSLAATLNGTPDFVNSYTLDALSRLREIDQQGQSGGNAVAQKSIYLKLNGIGEITEIDRSNSVYSGPQQTSPGWTTISYDTTTGLLDEIDDITAGTSIDDLTYTHDMLGRISTFGSIDGTATYGYDHTSQIVSAAYTTATGGHQPANVSFSWDANGNNAATGNVVSPNNEVTNDGTFTYQFDADGNRTVRTRISSDYASDYKTTYAWDYRNRLTDVEFYDNNNVLTKHVHYVYGVYDALIGESIDSTGSGSYDTTENFVLDVSPKLPVQVLSLSGTIDTSAPDDTVLESINGALAFRMLNAPSLSGAEVVAVEEAVNTLTTAGTDRWMLTNNQGTPTDIEDVNGVLIDHMVDSLTGVPVYESNPAVHHIEGFAGGRYDPSTGMINNWHRWYDPLATVWISADPAAFNMGDSNLRRYVRNLPSSLLDPSGLEEYSDPITHAPIGAPEEIQIIIGNLYSRPALLNRLMAIAKRQAEGVESAGYICWNKKVDRLVVYVYFDESQNTQFQSHRPWYYPGPESPKDSPLFGRPPKMGDGGKMVPMDDLLIYYGWHTHPTAGDAWPSKVDCDSATKLKLPAIVVYYMVRDGKDTWLIHIVGSDGKYYEWIPPAKDDQ